MEKDSPHWRDFFLDCLFAERTKIIWIRKRPAGFSAGSCHSQFNFPVYHVFLTIFEEPGHMATFAIAFQLGFVPLETTFDALKHEMTGSPRFKMSLKTSA